MPKVLADFCLNCNYPLVGLPPRHRCPECGQEYDEHIRVWKPARPRMVLFRSLGFGVGLIYLMVNGLRMLSWNSSVSRVMGLLILVATPCVAMYIVVRRRRRGFRVWFSPAGVGVQAAGPEVVVPWTRIVRLKRGDLYGLKSIGLRATLVRANEPPVPIIDFFDTDAELKDFLAEFETSRRTYLARLGDTPTGNAPTGVKPSNLTTTGTT